MHQQTQIVLQMNLLVHLQAVPIIEIPGFGSAAAQKVCQDMGIRSQVRIAITKELQGSVTVFGSS